MFKICRDTTRMHGAIYNRDQACNDRPKYILKHRSCVKYLGFILPNRSIRSCKEIREKRSKAELDQQKREYRRGDDAIPDISNRNHGEREKDTAILIWRCRGEIVLDGVKQGLIVHLLEEMRFGK